jgi:hypothetical protein
VKIFLFTAGTHSKAINVLVINGVSGSDEIEKYTGRAPAREFSFGSPRGDRRRAICLFVLPAGFEE